MLEQILNKIQEVDVDNTYLYFVTRVLKPDAKKAAKAMGKYNFKVYQIDVNDEIRVHLHTLAIDQLENLADKKKDLQEYDVISDDTENLFTYTMAGKAMSFSDVVNSQLKKMPPKIQSLKEIISDEELWAYTVGFFLGEDEWIYTFRKVLSGKVAINEEDGNKKGMWQKAIRTFFNTKNQKLELIQGETVSLDKQIDCVFYIDTFYIARKTQFEQIVGLEEEFKIQATEVVAELGGTAMIEGLNHVAGQVESNPAIHKKLVRLGKIGNHRDLDTTTIGKMVNVCAKYGDSLKTTQEGKLLIEDEKDIDLVLKMLSDYYKRGEVSGKAYGTFAGKQISIVNNK